MRQRGVALACKQAEQQLIEDISMQITLKEAGQRVANFAIDGARITVDGLLIDCSERQADVPVVVEVRKHAGTTVEGGKDGAYLAHIAIPARTYTENEVPGVGDEEEPTIERIADPINTDEIAVTLWPAA
jgi:hypothetical protein